jgi:hypothetical protein
VASSLAVALSADALKLEAENARIAQLQAAADARYAAALNAATQELENGVLAGFGSFIPPQTQADILSLGLTPPTWDRVAFNNPTTPDASGSVATDVSLVLDALSSAPGDVRPWVYVGVQSAADWTALVVGAVSPPVLLLVPDSGCVTNDPSGVYVDPNLSPPTGTGANLGSGIPRGGTSAGTRQM